MSKVERSPTGADAWRQAWESEAFGKPYGDLFFDRATGKLPEMESSKAAAARIAALAKSGDSLLDVGCGAGHYYRLSQHQIARPSNIALHRTRCHALLHEARVRGFLG